MPGPTKRLDAASRTVVAITLVLFVVALFVKGLGHDVLLEAGVFLVSVKLILMSWKNAAAAGALNDRLADLELAIRQIGASIDTLPARVDRRGGTAVE